MSKYILPESMKRWLNKCIIMQSLPSDYPFPAQVKLTPYGYIISLKSSPEGDERDTLLSHEIGHILRGDLLVKNVNPLLWNIAADACINSVLDRNIVRSLQGVDYDEVSKQYDLNPDQAPGAKIIYDLLKEDLKQQIAEGMMDQHEGMEGNEQECKKAHVKAILEAIAEGVLDENVIKRSAGSYGKSNTVISIPRRQPLLEQFLLAMRSAKLGGSPARYRSWIRPGRIPGMKGITRIPRAKIAVLADVSGSVVSMLPQILGASKALQKVCNVKVIVWASEAAWYKSPETVAQVGGGTQLCSAFELLENYNADGVVVITDGELADSTQSQKIAPKCPLIWCLTKDAKAPWKRPRDKVVELV